MKSTEELLENLKVIQIKPKYLEYSLYNRLCIMIYKKTSGDHF